MRNKSMTIEEYNALTASSPAYHFEGTIEKYWGWKYGAYVEKKALRLTDGSGVPFDALWPVSEHSCASFPVGTKIVIDIPAGTTPSYSLFTEKPMEWKTMNSFLWIKDNPDPPEIVEEESYTEEDV